MQYSWIDHRPALLDDLRSDEIMKNFTRFGKTTSEGEEEKLAQEARILATDADLRQISRIGREMKNFGNQANPLDCYAKFLQ